MMLTVQLEQTQETAGLGRPIEKIFSKPSAI